MPTFTDKARLSDVLKREFDPLFNREQAVIAAGADLAVGTVLGRITASGKYVAHDPALANGAQTAAAVLLFSADAAAADVEATILKRGPAVVAEDELIFKTGITAPQRTAALAALAEAGIVARKAIGADPYASL